MIRLILFLIRLKLGVKKNERFEFDNQKSHYDYYYINSDNIYKVMVRKYDIKTRPANVSLKWLLDPKCKIVRR